MPQEIIALPLKIGAYLIRTDDGFLLIDTSDPSDRIRLDEALTRAGVTPGSLKLVLITHGDVDHIGNAAFLQQKYAAKIACHPAEAEVLAQGNSSNRKAKPDRISFMGRLMFAIGGLFANSASTPKVTPDLLVEDGFDLSSYGCDACVLHLPGHTRGSIGILTLAGDLYCGDLLMNFTRPTLHFIIDDLADIRASVEKIRQLNVQTVYPGHGKPFPLSALER